MTPLCIPPYIATPVEKETHDIRKPSHLNHLGNRSLRHTSTTSGCKCRRSTGTVRPHSSQRGCHKGFGLRRNRHGSHCDHRRSIDRGCMWTRYGTGTEMAPGMARSSGCGNRFHQSHLHSHYLHHTPNAWRCTSGQRR